MSTSLPVVLVQKFGFSFRSVSVLISVSGVFLVNFFSILVSVMNFGFR